MECNTHREFVLIRTISLLFFGLIFVTSSICFAGSKLDTSPFFDSPDATPGIEVVNGLLKIANEISTYGIVSKSDNEKFQSLTTARVGVSVEDFVQSFLDLGYGEARDLKFRETLLERNFENGWTFSRWKYKPTDFPLNFIYFDPHDFEIRRVDIMDKSGEIREFAIIRCVYGDDEELGIQYEPPVKGAPQCFVEQLLD